MSQAHRICLVLPYFGTFPEWFYLWLESAAANSFIDFLILTDTPEAKITVCPSTLGTCKLCEYPAANIHVQKIQFADLKKRADAVLGFSCELGSPYKICDYKPLFGLMFEDLLRGYDFWGWCDPDVVWGNLRQFLTEERLDQFDKLYGLGHLTLYRNAEEINRHTLTYFTPALLNFWEVYHFSTTSHFDEFAGMWKLDLYLSKKGKLRIWYCLQDIADISPCSMRYESVWLRERYANQIYEYDHGHVYAWFDLDGTLVKREMAYIHLQKRKMSVETQDSQHYLMAACSFLPVQPITTELVRHYGEDKTVREFGQAAGAVRKRKDITLRWLFFKLLQYSRYHFCRYILRMR